MNLPPSGQIETLEEIRPYFDESSAGMLLLDRKGQVHLANQTVANMMERPLTEVSKGTFGDALGCIHTGDHRDGCGYGSICGECFLFKAVKQALKSREPVHDFEGVLAMGIKNKGVIRPQLKTSVTPITQQRRMYLVMSIAECDGSTLNGGAAH